jgi:hypothetical protein
LLSTTGMVSLRATMIGIWTIIVTDQQSDATNQQSDVDNQQTDIGRSTVECGQPSVSQT